MSIGGLPVNTTPARGSAPPARRRVAPRACPPSCAPGAARSRSSECQPMPMVAAANSESAGQRHPAVQQAIKQRRAVSWPAAANRAGGPTGHEDCEAFIHQIFLFSRRYSRRPAPRQHHGRRAIWGAQRLSRMESIIAWNICAIIAVMFKEDYVRRMMEQVSVAVTAILGSSGWAAIRVAGETDRSLQQLLWGCVSAWWTACPPSSWWPCCAGASGSTSASWWFWLSCSRLKATSMHAAPGRRGAGRYLNRWSCCWKLAFESEHDTYSPDCSTGRAATVDTSAPALGQIIRNNSRVRAAAGALPRAAARRQVLLRFERHFQQQLQRFKIAGLRLAGLVLRGIDVAFSLEQLSQNHQLADVEPLAPAQHGHQLGGGQARSTRLRTQPQAVAAKDRSVSASDSIAAQPNEPRMAVTATLTCSIMRRT